MFCEKCGHKLEDGSLFCEYCGAKLGQSVPVQQAPVYPPKMSAAPQSAAPGNIPGPGKKPGKRKGGKTAILIICILLGLALLGTGAFFLIRHFTGGEEKVPSRVLEQVNESARPEDYAGSYRGQVTFEVDLKVPDEDLGLLGSKMDSLRAMSGKAYDVTAELRDNELIVFCPDAPAADSDGELIRITVDPGQVEKGIARGTKKDGFGTKEFQTDTEVYLTNDGGIFVNYSETVEENGKVLVSVDSTVDLKPTTPPPAPTQAPTELPTEPPTEPEETASEPTAETIPPRKEPTARYHEIPEDHILFRNWSTAAVESGPPDDIRITLNKDIYIEAIMNWHWFVSGPEEYRTATIALEDANTGNVFGPWNVQCDSAENGQNMGAWIVFPETVIPAGDYILRDSNIESWSYVPEDTRDCGMTEIKGRLPTEDDTGITAGTYHAVFIGDSDEEIPPLDTLTPYEPPIPLIMKEDGTGEVLLPDSTISFTVSGNIMEATDDTGYQTEISFRSEGNALILTNPEGAVLIFIRQNN